MILLPTNASIEISRNRAGRRVILFSSTWYCYSLTLSEEQSDDRMIQSELDAIVGKFANECLRNIADNPPAEVIHTMRNGIAITIPPWLLLAEVDFPLDGFDADGRAIGTVLIRISASTIVNRMKFSSDWILSKYQTGWCSSRPHEYGALVAKFARNFVEMYGSHAGDYRKPTSVPAGPRFSDDAPVPIVVRESDG